MKPFQKHLLALLLCIYLASVPCTSPPRAFAYSPSAQPIYISLTQAVLSVVDRLYGTIAEGIVDLADFIISPPYSTVVSYSSPPHVAQTASVVQSNEQGILPPFPSTPTPPAPRYVTDEQLAADIKALMLLMLSSNAEHSSSLSVSPSPDASHVEGQIAALQAEIAISQRINNLGGSTNPTLTISSPVISTPTISAPTISGGTFSNITLSQSSIDATSLTVEGAASVTGTSTFATLGGNVGIGTTTPTNTSTSTATTTSLE